MVIQMVPHARMRASASSSEGLGARAARHWAKHPGRRIPGRGPFARTVKVHAAGPLAAHRSSRFRGPRAGGFAHPERREAAAPPKSTPPCLSRTARHPMCPPRLPADGQWRCQVWPWSHMGGRVEGPGELTAILAPNRRQPAQGDSQERDDQEEPLRVPPRRLRQTAAPPKEGEGEGAHQETTPHKASSTPCHGHPGGSGRVAGPGRGSHQRSLGLGTDGTTQGQPRSCHPAGASREAVNPPEGKPSEDPPSGEPQTTLVPRLRHQEKGP